MNRPLVHASEIVAYRQERAKKLGLTVEEYLKRASQLAHESHVDEAAFQASISAQNGAVPTGDIDWREGLKEVGA